MSTLTLKNLHEAERFVVRQTRLGSDIRWENYDIVVHRESPQAVYSKDGAFRDGSWGFENRAPVTDEGTWEIDFRNVRRAPRTRN